MALNPGSYMTEGSEPVKSTDRSYCFTWINSSDSCSECLQESEVYETRCAFSGVKMNVEFMLHCDRFGFVFLTWTRVEIGKGNGARVSVQNHRAQCHTAQGGIAYCYTEGLKRPKGTLVNECSLEWAGDLHIYKHNHVSCGKVLLERQKSGLLWTRT